MPVLDTANAHLERIASGIAFLKLAVAGRGVNVFNREVLADLDTTLDAVASSPPKLLLLVSTKKSGFVAGADMHEFASIQNTDEARALSARGQELFAKLARLPVPTLAIIHGPCLGGGLEFALACDYRVALDQPSTQFGLPEIELGLIPGWGGTQRLPRVIGLERALQVILGSKRLDARQALAWGLVDDLAAPQADVVTAPPDLVERCLREGKRARSGLPLQTWRQRLLETTPAGRWLLFRATERVLKRRVPDDMPGPREALEAVRTGLARGIDAGLAHEREAIGRLVTTPACRNLVQLFFQREKARKLPQDLAADSSPQIRRVGVVGAGTMGAGIAQLAALKGCDVVIQEMNAEALGMATFKIAALFEKALERRLITEEELRRKLSAVHGTVDWQGFSDVDLVVEAAIEDLAAKQAIFRELEKHTRAGTILATNTSSLPVARLADGLKHPERVASLHFFNPVHKMPLVEVARTPATDERTVATLAQWAVGLGKTPVVVKDSPGFVVNRILVPYLNEAVLLVAEGLPIEQVDRVMVRFGMPMGPLELLDQVGLDVAAHIARALQPAFAGRFPDNPAYEQMTNRGWLGQKNGVGFYRYAGKKKRANRFAQALIHQEQSGAATKLPPAARLTEARERMVLLMCNEATACLAEGLAGDAGAIDLAMVMGTGWAPFRGGPLQYLADRGADDVVQALRTLAQRHGPRFAPCAALRGEPGA
jgi:3-hydroxyacyl-CoA dehydrogenase/enoyl-CoA hydratase/3-hydroxybutyryl-CoA epimerase